MGTVRRSAAERSGHPRRWLTRDPAPAKVTWYRARKPLPAVITVVVLSVVTALAWITVLNRVEPVAHNCADAARAAASAAGSPVVPVAPGERLTPDDLADTPPAPPQQVEVQVLNANGMRGQASIVTGDLEKLGFAPTTEPANDPVHPEFDLLCHGEIRFGAAGEPAARTLSLAVPCADLVRDARPDSQVDLALGTEFLNVRPNHAAHEALRDLTRLADPRLGDPLPGVNQQAGPGSRGAFPGVDPELLRAAYHVQC